MILSQKTEIDNESQNEIYLIDNRPDNRNFHNFIFPFKSAGIANIVKDNGFVLLSKKTKGIDHISKLKNCTISTWFIGHEYQLKTLLKKYNLTEKEIKMTSQKWVYNDEIDVVSAMSYNELLNVFDNGYSKNELNIFNFRDEGVGFPGQNIFTTRSFYKANPLICKKFVKASIKGWQYAIDHPEEAVNIVMKYDYEKRIISLFQIFIKNMG